MKLFPSLFHKSLYVHTLNIIKHFLHKIFPLFMRHSPNLLQEEKRANRKKQPKKISEKPEKQEKTSSKKKKFSWMFC